MGCTSSEKDHLPILEASSEGALEGFPTLVGATQDNPEVLWAASINKRLGTAHSMQPRSSTKSVCNPETNSAFSRVDAGQEGGLGHPVPEHKPTS